MTQIEPIELEEFVKQTIKQIESGAEGRAIPGDVRFELSVVKTDKVSGGLKFYVVSGGGVDSSEQVHKIAFSVKPNSPESSLEGFNWEGRIPDDARD